MEPIIEQKVTLPASPDKVYRALTSGEDFGAFTGAPANVTAEEGARFALFGDNIVGRNVELVPGRRVVQAWRVANWEEGLYSLVRFELRDSGGKTELSFKHTGFPEAEKDHLSDGWKKMYWDPMKSFLK